MSLNRAVRFGPSLAQSDKMGVILNLGYINPTEPVLTTPEGAGVFAGGGLLVAGALVKGKGGMAMMVVGGLAALLGIGSAAYRALANPATSVPFVAPALPAAPPPKPSVQQQAQQIVQQLAPTLTPLIKNLFKTDQPAPSQFVTNLSGW